MAGVSNVSVGQADHMAVVTQLKPEEDETGAGRQTIEPEVIKSEQFQQTCSRSLQTTPTYRASSGGEG